VLCTRAVAAVAGVLVDCLEAVEGVGCGVIFADGVAAGVLAGVDGMELGEGFITCMGCGDGDATFTFFSHSFSESNVNNR
jgi:hypothetical protein